jgi:SagB-type dehydrogenase family enzyme
MVVAADGHASLPILYYHLQRCNAFGLLCYRLVASDQTIATVVPMTGGLNVTQSSIGARTLFRLSRFAYCRRHGDMLLVESPLSLARTLLSGGVGGAMIAELARPRTYIDLCSRVADVSEDAAHAFVSLLADTALVAEVGENQSLVEDENHSLAQWDFHDLLFHSRSRHGRHDYPIGGTFPFVGKVPPLPAVKPAMSENVVPLYRPDIARLEREDLPFARVLESRKSIRNYGDDPITARQLGEFLYRVARVRELIDPTPHQATHYQTSNRPYPSGGASYDLELYVAANRCSGVSTGLYHYDPLAHQLAKLADCDAAVQALVRHAQQCAESACAPQALILIACRFQRLSWKYSGVAYATTLKNVGVLYQTMYLVATAMGLAPCALGVGNSALFAEIVGTDYFAESSVGEFLLGSSARRSDG